MSAAVALMQASWRSASSYRVRFLLSFGAICVSIVPLYFVANAMQPLMAEAIATEGGQFFGFLIVGMLVMLLIPTAVNSLPNEINSGINTGVLEAVLGTPARQSSIFAGMIGFSLIWAALRGAVMLIAGTALGANVLWTQMAVAIPIVLLIVVSYIPFGLLAAALVIAFRTSGPLPQVVLALSTFLGGVYYPVSVIPSWIERVSSAIPLTYGLRALRAVLLEGDSLASVVDEILVVAAMTAGLFVLGVMAMRAALRYARRAGTLSHY